MREKIARIMQEKIDDACLDRHFALQEMQEAEKAFKHKTLRWERAKATVVNMKKLKQLLIELG